MKERERLDYYPPPPKKQQQTPKFNTQGFLIVTKPIRE